MAAIIQRRTPPTAISAKTNRTAPIGGKGTKARLCEDSRVSRPALPDRSYRDDVRADGP
jgi:hypothetical protein